LNVLRPGTYRFFALVEGQVRLHVQGKEVLNVKQEKSLAADTAALGGSETKLEAGIHPVVAEFTRLRPAARLELFWQFQQARREPLGYELFFHLPERAADKLAAQQLQERGRLLAEEHGCATCHQVADSDRLAKALHARPGPDLSQVGGRVHAGWIY